MKVVFQLNQMDCGPACIATVGTHYGKNINLDFIRNHCFPEKDGISMSSLIYAAKGIGFKTQVAKMGVENLDNDLLPCILHWNKNHYVVLNKIFQDFFTKKRKFKIADPSHGFVTLGEDKFKNSWVSNANKGIALFLEPTLDFYSKKFPCEANWGLGRLFGYLKPHYKQVIWMCVLLLFGTLITTSFPYLTQKLIDEGVVHKNLNLISYILLAQLAFFIGNIVIGVLRNWIALTMGTKINIRIISDFIKKTLSLPIKYFETRLMGDFSQRILDHERIESFLTSHSLLTLFSIITFSVFFIFLWHYNYQILLIYVSLTILSVLWSLFWLRKRKMMDYFRFQLKGENQQSIYEIVTGVSEMKVNQFEEYKRKKWEDIQYKMFTVNIRILKFEQLQLSGFEFINQFKNIFVTFISAFFVVKGNMTLGELLSVSYIIGQMNSPINQLVAFLRSLQDAKLSLARLSEVQGLDNEERGDQKNIVLPDSIENGNKSAGILLNNVSFQYGNFQSPFVLKDINLFIPDGKITAIVGESGSGKTTLMKLLLKFYEPTRGDIYFNDFNINELSAQSIRINCGVVMQDGFVFSDSIKNNIACGENSDLDRIERALKIANIDAFVRELPLGLETKIGASGNGLSGGQTQRLLIARAVYKNPHYIFFDEATSSLDAENEKIIYKSLQSFLKGRTSVIIAHRLSTVKDADQIIVLRKGEIVEVGNHSELTLKMGYYFNLVKNQLELGS